MRKKMRFISHISNLADVQSVRTPTLRIPLQVYMLYISVESSVCVDFNEGQNGTNGIQEFKSALSLKYTV